MKKNIYLLILSAVLLLCGIASCDSKLDIPKHGSAALEGYYQTDVEAEEGIVGVYSKFAGIYYNYYFLKNMLSDDFWAGGGGRGDNNQIEQLNEYTFAPQHSMITGVFQDYYGVIYLSNVVINRVPGGTPIQDRAKAEAKIFRAFAYIDLISMWGTPPLVDHELTSSEYQMPNGDPAQLWGLVEQDLTEAINSNALSQKRDINDNSNYRLSVQFAKALLGKAYLFQEKYAEAAKILNDCIDDNKYDLYRGNYEDILMYTTDNNCESVFEVNRLNDPNNAFTNWSLLSAMIGWRGDRMVINSGVYNGCWGFGNPQKDLYDEFVKREGDNGYRLLATMKDYNHLLAQGDQIVAGKSMYGHEGYFMWKNRVLAEEFIPGGWVSSHNNITYMRYAEVLLLAAEACFKSNDMTNALKYVNLIRDRAKLPALSSVTMDDIMVEKRLELCGECVRYQDMIRWGIGNKMKDQGKKTPNFGSDGNVTWTVFNQGDVAGFKDKHNLLPFPEVECQMNKNLVQNNGW